VLIIATARLVTEIAHILGPGFKNLQQQKFWIFSNWGSLKISRFTWGGGFCDGTVDFFPVSPLNLQIRRDFSKFNVHDIYDRFWTIVLRIDKILILCKQAYLWCTFIELSMTNLNLKLTLLQSRLDSVVSRISKWGGDTTDTRRATSPGRTPARWWRSKWRVVPVKKRN